MKLKYLLIALLALTFASCSEDLMDRINEDKANPVGESVDGKFVIPGAVLSTAFNTISGNYAWYISSFTEQEFGTGNNQLMRTELRIMSEYMATSCFNNEWNDTYSTLKSLKDVIDKCADGASNAGQADLLGMAQTLTALDLGILTDLHGDIPYSQALQGDKNLQPELDSQENIYKDIFQLLDNAIANLQEGGSNVGESDILFGGNCNKWLGLAYALKARYKLHTYFRDRNVLPEVIAAANAAIAAGFDGAELDVFNGVTADNPWSAYWWSRFYTGSSTTVDNLMLERDDPREEVYNVKFYQQNVIGQPGDDAIARSTAGMNAPAWLNNGAQTIHVFSKSELYFILAEAKARLGQDASSDMATAIEASIIDYAVTDPGYSTIGYFYPMSAEDIQKDEYAQAMGLSGDGKSIIASWTADYIAALPVTLKEIMVQKYLAQTRDEQIEAYNDIRRCKALGEEHVKLTNPKNSGSTGNTWPLRLPYGSSDVTSNPNVSAAFGTGNDAGQYIFTEPVWWAGGSR